VQLPLGAGSENAAGQPGAFASRAASFDRASLAEPPSPDVPPPPLLDELVPPLLEEEEEEEPPSASPTDAEDPPQAPMTHTASIAGGEYRTRILSS
jgi:hypothetical protein